MKKPKPVEVEEKPKIVKKVEGHLSEAEAALRPEEGGEANGKESLQRNCRGGIIDC